MSHWGSREILTQRLQVRPWSETDAEAAMRIYSSPAIASWHSEGFTPPDNLAEMQAQLRRWIEEDGGSKGYVGHWAICTHGEGTVVGTAFLRRSPHGGGSPVLGWALDPAYWGHGYASEAGAALMRWAMHEAGEPEVFAILHSDNARAVRTAVRIGMERVPARGTLLDEDYLLFRVRHGELAWQDEPLANGRPGGTSS